MDVGYLVQMLNNKMVALNNAKTQAVLVGDLDAVNNIETEVLSVQNTIAQLNLVQQITAAAAAANITTAQVVASGINTTPNTLTPSTDPLSVLAFYDLSTYASDPLYLQKITDILTVMPELLTASDIDSYIDSEAIGSPLTGAMILNAAGQYNIDVRLLVAILELESNFGTAGVAVSTINPGNVGNTGSSTRTYNSWQDGVAAVAYWLSRHPAAASVDPTPQATEPPPFTHSAIIVNQPNSTPTPVPTPVVPTPTPTPTPTLETTPTPTPTPEPTPTPQPTPVPTPEPTPIPTSPANDDPAPTPTPQPTPPDTSASSSPISMGTKKKRRLIV